VKDRRQDIIQAGLTVLREHGFSGFTQPRVASQAGMRQSHLTYYFPTRLDLLTAVARTAIEGQLGAIDAVFGGSSPQSVAAAIADITVRHENTRVLMALAQAADQEPQLRQLFRELADGIILRADKLLGALKIRSTDNHRYLMHALSVGLAVIDLATARPDGKRRATAVLNTTLRLFSLEVASNPEAEREPEQRAKQRKS
jgi:DNA-binding transcriptional regulator YbjK